jgi:hypothetical protein
LNIHHYSHREDEIDTEMKRRNERTHHARDAWRMSYTVDDEMIVSGQTQL